LKFGGEKALTKHSTEDGLKSNLTLEEPNKLGENALSICNVQNSSKLKNEIELIQINTDIKPNLKELKRIMLELYNLEDYDESENKVKINLDLDLYQMERV
jgi:hypothetical protein